MMFLRAAHLKYRKKTVPVMKKGRPDELSFPVTTASGRRIENAFFACSPHAFNRDIHIVDKDPRKKSRRRPRDVLTSPVEVVRAMVAHPSFELPPSPSSKIYLSNCVKVRLGAINDFEFRDLYKALPASKDNDDDDGTRLTILGVFAANAKITGGRIGVNVYMVDEEESSSPSTLLGGRKDLHIFPDPKLHCVVSNGRGGSDVRTACYLYDSTKPRLDHAIQVLTLSHHCDPPPLFTAHPVLWTVPLPVTKSSLEFGIVDEKCTIPADETRVGKRTARSLITFPMGYAFFEANTSKPTSVKTTSSNRLHNAFVEFLLHPDSDVLRRLHEKEPSASSSSSSPGVETVVKSKVSKNEYYVDTVIFDQALECFNAWLRLIRSDFRLNPQNLHISSLDVHDPEAVLDFDAYVVYALTTPSSSSSTSSSTSSSITKPI